MTYRERPTSVPGAILWERTVGSTPERTRILPDGCMDVLWDGCRLFVAGPDSRARWHDSRAGTSYVAVRFSGGVGPALLGVPAGAVRDRSPDLDRFWPPGEVAALSERLGDDPVVAFDDWLEERASRRWIDPFGPAVHEMADVGVPAASIADRLGMSVRQLHRRCVPVFGYGPRVLTRVLRMGRALAAAGAGAPLAQVAADCGYADQAHLCREVRSLTGTTPGALVQELVAG